MGIARSPGFSAMRVSPPVRSGLSACGAGRDSRSRNASRSAAVCGLTTARASADERRGRITSGRTTSSRIGRQTAVSTGTDPGGAEAFFLGGDRSPGRPLPLSAVFRRTCAPTTDRNSRPRPSGSGSADSTYLRSSSSRAVPGRTATSSPSMPDCETSISTARSSTRLKEVQVLTERWRWQYNHVRPHQSLGYRPPAPEARDWPLAASREDKQPAIH